MTYGKVNTLDLLIHVPRMILKVYHLLFELDDPKSRSRFAIPAVIFALSMRYPR